MLPTLRQLQYLTLLARHGSFSKAAQAAHVSQPTLSAGIQELERTLGGPVVERARAGAVLTAVGEAAARRAAEVLAAAEDLVQAAQAAGRPLCGRFRLGVIPTIAPFLLPRALPALRARFPELRLFLREEQTQRLAAALRTGELDAALIALPADITGLDTATVGEDALVAAMPAHHRLADRTVIDADDMADEELILLEDGHCLRDHALAACRVEGRGSGHETAFAATSLATLVQMVGAGLGVSLLPAMAARAGLADLAEVETRPLADAHARREIVVAWRAGSSRGAEARLLAEVLRDA